MADNYLERKMEEYRSGNLGRRTARNVGGSTLPKGKIAVDFPPRIVIVVGECDAVSHGVVSRFVSAGCKTAFCSNEPKDGAALSQAFGARFYPVKKLDEDSLGEVLCDLKQHWGRPDTLIINHRERPYGAVDVLDVRFLEALDNSEGQLRIIEIASMPDDSEESDWSGKAYGDRIDGQINRIVVGERSEKCGERVGSLCVYICEPCGRFLAGQIFKVD